MKKLLFSDFLRLRKLVYRSARPLAFTMWNYLFENGSLDDFLSVLTVYQNEDGGFGYNIECNNWNPNSSPYTVCIALDYLDVAGEIENQIKNKIISGILRYLNSGAFLLDDGWVGMQGIPSNNDFAHMPWFHFDKKKAEEADIGLTKRLCTFIKKYADRDSELCRKAEILQDKYRECEQVLLNGFPDYDPVALKIDSYDPNTWPSWLPLPIYFIGSPESSYYKELRQVADRNLDTIIEKLQKTCEISIATEEEINTFEKNTPHPEGKRWSVTEQAIGNYYWGAHFITSDIDLLRKFGRLDFLLPVHTK